MEIKEELAVDVWLSALQYIYKNGKDFVDKDRRVCRQITGLYMVVKNPEKNITEPIEIMNSAFDWIYPELEEIRNIVLSKKVPPVYYYAYGPRLFNFNNEVDQINDFIIPLLKKDPSSRRAVAVIYNPVTDSKIFNEEIPAFILINFRISKNKLYVIGYLRSNDVYFGWPANIYHLYVIQNYVADKLGVKVGSISTFSASAHIFKEHFDNIKQLISKKH